MTRALGSHAGAAGGRSGPREAPPGRAKGLSGELHVQDAQAWAERKPRAKERACSTSPLAAWGAEGCDHPCACTRVCLS